MTLLGLIEDDKNIATTLKIALESSHFEVNHYESAESYLTLGLIKNHALLIIDINLPNMSGLSLCSVVKQKLPQTPIIVLTAKLDEQTAVKALQGGADDFVRKPFGFQELKARIQKLLEKTKKKSTDIEYSGLRLNKNSMCGYFQNNNLNLTPSEFEILFLLSASPGDILTREVIISRLDPQGDIQERTLDSHVSRIRQKLKSAGCINLKISSAYGTGYRLEETSDEK